MKLGKYGTWLAVGLLSGVVAAVGLELSLRADTWWPLIWAYVPILLYVTGTFWIGFPLFGRTTRTRNDRQELALTFDDGPDPRHTAAISRALAERGHVGTFFVLAKHAAPHPELIRQLVEDGHEIANHGDDHRLLAFALPRTLRAQLRAAEDAVEAAVGRQPAPLFRPPHGVRSPWLHLSVARAGYRVAGWRGSVFDTANPGVETIVERASQLLRPGAVILLHDGDGSGEQGSRQQTVEAIPAILDEAERRGLRSVALSSLIA